jgi:DNA-binding beta-propeller fold protein YncE
VDPSSLKIDETISIPGEPHAFSVVDGSVWLAVHTPDGKAGALLPLTDGELGEPLLLPKAPFHVAGFDGRLWVTYHGEDSIGWVDPANGTSGALQRVGTNPVDIELVRDELWVAVSGENRIAIVDPASGVEFDEIHVDGQPWKMTQDFGRVWVSVRSGEDRPGTVVGIDPESRSMSDPIAVRREPDEIAAHDGRLFVANYGDSTISVVTPAVV